MNTPIKTVIEFMNKMHSTSMMIANCSGKSAIEISESFDKMLSKYKVDIFNKFCTGESECSSITGDSDEYNYDLYSVVSNKISNGMHKIEIENIKSTDYHKGRKHQFTLIEVNGEWRISERRAKAPGTTKWVKIEL
jgi:hypothetical protein